MSKRAKIITLITILVIIIIGLISFMIHAISTKSFHFGKFLISSNISTNLVYDETYEKTFSKIQIESDNADIKIKQSKDENIKIEIYSDEKDNDITLNSDKELNIRLNAKAKFSLFQINNTSSQIIVSVPENYDKDIKIVNHYGDVMVEELINSHLNINSDCGDIEIEKAKVVQARNSYGDTIIHNADTISVESDCGDIEVGTVKAIKIENSYGDIEIKNIRESMDIVADCGDIDIDSVSLIKNSKIKSDFGDVSIENIKNVYVDAKADFGEVSIKKNDRAASITLIIESDCGDVEVN